MSRPENQLPAEFFYNDIEATKYTNCTRIIEIQSQMTQRAIELLNLEEGLILDIGCGSGLSGEQLSETGFEWVGLDISSDMLNVAIERGCYGDLYHCDMGQGFKFRPGFDLIQEFLMGQSVLVLCNGFVWQVRKPITPGSLYNSLKSGGRAVLQFYPENNQQIDMITKSLLKQGFSGGIIVDYPNSSKNKKYYLVIDAGGSGNQEVQIIDGLKEEDGQDQVQYMKKQFIIIEKINMRTQKKIKKQFIKVKNGFKKRKNQQGRKQILQLGRKNKA